MEGNHPVASSPTWDEAHPHDVASLLKQFLRELPESLLSSKFIDAFEACEGEREIISYSCVYV